MLTTIIDHVLAWDRNRTTIRILRGMDDRQLADMGIARDRIPEVVRRTAAKNSTQPVKTISLQRTACSDGVA